MVVINAPRNEVHPHACGEHFYPRSLRIRCWVHKMRNLSVKLPSEIWMQIKPEISAIQDALTYEEGKERLQKVIKNMSGHIRHLPNAWRKIQMIC